MPNLPKEVSLPLLLKNAPAGHSFVTFRGDSYLTSYASRYGMKIRTEQAKMTLPSSDLLIPITLTTVIEAYDKKIHQNLNKIKKKHASSHS